MDEQGITAAIERLRRLLSAGPFPENTCRTFTAPGLSSDAMFDIFVSRTIRHSVHDDDHVRHWINDRLSGVSIGSEVVPLQNTERWHIDPDSGDISHEAGRFFSIVGLNVRHRVQYEEMTWDQPIIEQPEVGILGIMAKYICGILHFCLQAKEEPGNINLVQLAPTVQATFSNYTQSHGGRKPPFIEIFLDPPPGSVLFSKLQAEDGGRFLYKSNKNMILLTSDRNMDELPDSFIWLTLRQIAFLMKYDNLINSCARSVLSCLI